MPAVTSATCQVVAQAILWGSRRSGFAPSAASRAGSPYISVRIGRVLLNLEDRDALTSLVEGTRLQPGTPRPPSGRYGGHNVMDVLRRAITGQAWMPPNPAPT